MEEEKLYRVKIKNGAHINEKLKDDGSRAAIQFDDENGLQGPVDLVEVDRSEYTKEVYIEVEHSARGFGRAIVKDAVVPAVSDVLTVIFVKAAETGINAFENWMSQKVIPAVKTKGTELLDWAFESLETRKKVQRVDKVTSTVATREKLSISSTFEKQRDGTIVHTHEEVNQILNNMKFASLYIAAGIRELSNTVIADDGSDPEKRIAMETKLRELSSEDVMNTIEFMLEDRNRETLDQATIQLFEAFRLKNFIVDGEAIPISCYLTDISEKNNR